MTTDCRADPVMDANVTAPEMTTNTVFLSVKGGQNHQSKNEGGGNGKLLSEFYINFLDSKGRQRISNGGAPLSLAPLLQ